VCMCFAVSLSVSFLSGPSTFQSLPITLSRCYALEAVPYTWECHRGRKRERERGGRGTERYWLRTKPLKWCGQIQRCLIFVIMNGFWKAFYKQLF